MHRLGAVGRDPVGLAGSKHGLPHRQTRCRRHVDLEGELARERDACHASRHSCHHSVLDLHELEAVLCDIELGSERRHHRARLRPNHGHRRPLLRHARQPDIEVGPLGLEKILHPIKHAGRATRGRRRHEVVFGNTQDDTVVEDHAVGFAHHAIAGTADLERAHRARVEPIEKDANVLATQIDLAERRGVHHADALAHRRALAQHGRVHVLVALREEPGSLPLADILEDGSMCDMPRMDRRRADGVETRTERTTGQRTERDRLGWWSRIRHANRAEVEVEVVGRQAPRVDLGRAALLRTRADERVALEVLHVRDARVERALDAGHRDVAVMIDEGVRLVAIGCSHADKICGRLLGNISSLGRRRTAGGRAKARCLGSNKTDQVPIATTRRGAKDACSGTGYTLASDDVVLHEGQQLLVPARRATKVVMQVEERIPATRHSQHIAGDQFGVPATKRCHDHARERTILRGRGVHDDAPTTHLNAQLARTTGQPALRIGTNVNYQRHVHTRVDQIEHRAIGIVVGRKDHGALRHEAIAMQVATHASREHHARTIIVRKNEWALSGTRRDHELVCAHLPHATQGTAAALCLGQMLTDALHQCDRALVTNVEDGRAREDRHRRVVPQALLDVGDPQVRRSIVDHRVLAQQRAAEVRMFIHEQDPCAGLSGCQCSGETSRSSTRHEHIAMGVALFETISVGTRRQDALMNATRRRQSLVDLDLRQAHQRLGRLARTDLSKGVRIGHVVGDDTTRAVHQYARTEHADTVRQQSRGNRVARVRAHRTPIPQEGDRTIVVDTAATGEALHRASSGCSPLR